MNKPEYTEAALTLHLDCGQAWGCILVQVVDMDRLDSLTLRQMQRYIRAAGVTDLSSSAPDEFPEVTMSWPNLIFSGGVLTRTKGCIK